MYVQCSWEQTVTESCSFTPLIGPGLDMTLKPTYRSKGHMWTQQADLHTRYSPTSTLALSREHSIRSKEQRKLLLCSYTTIACNVFQNLVVRCTPGNHVNPMANKWCVPKLMVPKPNL
jgi:hypothetical protein